MAISVIKKRDGRIVSFDVQKISNAIQKSFLADEPGRNHEDLADALAWEVYSLLDLEGDPAPTVEHVQDIVEQVLMREGYGQTAKSYILYRQERTNVRNRDPQGCGTITLAPPKGSTSFVEQALTVYRAVRDNGGCQQLKGFYAVMAPGVADEFRRQYVNYLRFALELTANLRVTEHTLHSIDRTLEGLDLRPEMGENEAYFARQTDLICGAMGCDREPVEQAQKLAAPRAKEAITRRCIRTVTTLLAFLEAGGCPRERIDPGTESGVEVRLLRDILRG